MVGILWLITEKFDNLCSGVSELLPLILERLKLIPLRKNSTAPMFMGRFTWNLPVWMAISQSVISFAFFVFLLTSRLEKCRAKMHFFPLAKIMIIWRYLSASETIVISKCMEKLDRPWNFPNPSILFRNTDPEWRIARLKRLAQNDPLWDGSGRPTALLQWQWVIIGSWDLWLSTQCREDVVELTALPLAATFINLLEVSFSARTPNLNLEQKHCLKAQQEVLMCSKMLNIVPLKVWTPTSLNLIKAKQAKG